MFELGRSKLSTTKLDRLAVLFGVDPAELLRETVRPATLSRIRTLPATGGPTRRRGQVAA